MKFAKLFDIGDYQILLDISYNDEEDTYDLSVICDIDGTRAVQTYSYDERETAHNNMDKINQQNAGEFLTYFKNLLGE